MNVEPLELAVALTPVYFVVPAALIAVAVDFFRELTR